VNSSELSSLAGVSIRTLRHYHQVGILDEPPRTTNRYRQYGVHDLIRVLRIRRLAALGISLEQMPSLLDDEDHGAGLVLDRLDDEIAAQIERLTASSSRSSAFSPPPPTSPQNWHGSSPTSTRRRLLTSYASTVIKRCFSRTWLGPLGCRTSCASTNA
jgi:DNA-binding transcriptional MerR regulator